ncbi:Teichoic acid biosynthesis protein C (Precursor) [Streptomyces actinomycinicus]|uniref:Teichoic acid biosynthesis protein C (Precursor) n=1 Tax=Streptomyces actinomycinicus TaxID=1695166 RepID=A0A937EDH0_9ACTN|nr:Teichoic acid biosynthesis protein C (Precursor) [Streptomyces actinomycinicus]MBL1080387.1 Teichoic acid biosynthesis protein C (Precursor) [Streptomyces actinomycinicus]
MEQRIDLAAPAVRWLRQLDTLREPTVLQSFAFDEVHHHLYVLQLVRGGRDAGDLCLNRLDHAGRRLGHMYLKGFGHGVSMGVQHDADGTVWIWTEADAAGGYGRGVTRFRFAGGATRTPRDVRVRHPIAGSHANQPGICPATGRIAVRHRTGGTPRYRVWDLAAFTAREYGSPLADFPQTGAHPDPDVPFQGFALHGDHLYQLAGSAYDPRTNPPAGHGNTYLSCLDIRTGELIARHRTQAARSLDLREPEGLAVRHTGTPRLYVGFASGRAGARKFSIYYK